MPHLTVSPNQTQKAEQFICHWLSCFPTICSCHIPMPPLQTFHTSQFNNHCVRL